MNEYSPIDIFNSGDIEATATATSFFSYAYGITAIVEDPDSSIKIENHGEITVTADDFRAFGIVASAASIFTTNNPIDIINSGTIRVTSVEAETIGIAARTDDPGSPISIKNSGDIIATTADDAYGIRARTYGVGNLVDIDNSGDIVTATTGGNAYGIRAVADGDGNLIDIANNGNVTVTTTGDSTNAVGIYAQSGDSFGPAAANNRIDIDNRGHLRVTASGADANAIGIGTENGSSATPTHITNRGDIDVSTSGDALFTVGILANGPISPTNEPDSPVTVVNYGDITVSASNLSANIVGGIAAATQGIASPVLIENHGNITVTADPSTGAGIAAQARNSTATIVNSGSVLGDGAGIYTLSNVGSSIINSGYVSSRSLLAIQVTGDGNAEIFNSGVIYGFVRLDADDLMVIEPGGLFEVRLTSDFDATGPGGNDLFRNSGTVHALALNGVQPGFVNLERFENSGLISLIDGDTDDIFRISNSAAPATNLDFAASGKSALAIDAFLGGPGSPADNFVLDGNVFGQTQVIVNNTKAGGGVFNPQGIPTVFVNGNVSSDAFYMPKPLDTGLFDWDVYFVPTGSGVFELRSFPGGGAHQLPQLLTAAQDIWHTTSETWFDRTADLRVLLNGGAVYGAEGMAGGQPGVALTPGVWLRGSGTWLEQDDSAKTTAYGRTYRYDLGRELNLWNLEGGVDFGKKGVWAEGDALLFGLLGGAILGSLDYDQLVRKFDIEGGEVGAYLTYLSGGLFVDTLAKVDFLEFDTNHALGLPATLDATTWGVRTDAGYRFGQFRRGPFVEPLATIAVAWTELDDFSYVGNSVKFNDEADVKGRLGLRVGTSRELWRAIVMEPFVIGSLWGHLAGENEATVTAFGPFSDEPDDVWGEVSTGVNFFSPGANTSLFAKLDVTFGDETEGVSARGGMRHSW
jgi:outer membrane autotransporter protein